MAPISLSIIRTVYARETSGDPHPQTRSSLVPETSTIIAIVFGFAAVTIITISACLIVRHRRTQRTSDTADAQRWQAVLGVSNSDSEPSSTPSTAGGKFKEPPKPVPMLQPMAFLQGREGPKDFVHAGGKKRRSSVLPRVIADGFGGIFPRRGSQFTLSSSHPGSEEGGQDPISRRATIKSFRSKRHSAATTLGRNPSTTTNKDRLTATVQLERSDEGQSFIPGPATLSTSPSAFPSSQSHYSTSYLGQDLVSPSNSGSTSYTPPSRNTRTYVPRKPVNKKHHPAGVSFLEEDVNYYSPTSPSTTTTISSQVWQPQGHPQDFLDIPSVPAIPKQYLTQPSFSK